MSQMLGYEEALERVLKMVPPPKPVCLPLALAAGLVLAEDIYADLDLPPFDRSAMDGYALRSQDVATVPSPVRIVETIAAGSPGRMTIGPGEAAAIMTGAAVPAGADAVQMVEKTRSISSSEVEILASVQAGENITPRGSEVATGTVVLQAGSLLDAARIGVLATFGNSSVPVFRPPLAAILATGDELVEVHRQPGPGEIRNSNSAMLAAQCEELGLQVGSQLIVPDDAALTRKALESSAESELLIWSGGVSVGEFDFVHRILAEEGVEIVFHKVKVKPGKPVLMGRRDNQLIFGLPGNPVSSFVTFELFVGPAVRKWMGFEGRGRLFVRAVLEQEIAQKPGRRFFRPGHTRFREGRFSVEPIITGGSADLTAFSRANSLLIMPEESSRMKAGEECDAILLDKFFLEGS